MNLFRSEEHARAWSGFTAEAEGGLLPLQGIWEIFSAPFFRERGNGRYISSMPELRGEFMATLARVSGGHPFWGIPST